MLPPLAAALDAASARSTNIRGTRLGTPAARRFSSRPSAASSSTTSARTCCAPTSRSASDALGSLLDHTGPIGEHENYAARVFGAHRTYSVTNGTSTSNRVIFIAAVGDGEIALCDRNCHKSIEHGLVLTRRHSRPISCRSQPLRTHWADSAGAPCACSDRVRHPRQPAWSTTRCRRARSTRSSRTRPTTACATTPAASSQLLDPSVDRVHFDEAWYALRALQSALSRAATRCTATRKTTQGPTVFATHSTHKLLAALSQASFLHVRRRRAADFARTIQRVVHDARVDVAAVSRSSRRTTSRPR